MGFLKGCLKVVGTAALGAGWFASGVIRKAADAAGIEPLAELADAGVNASANSIKQIWGTESIDENIDETDAEIAELMRQKARKRSAATRCWEMASAAKQVGNDEKYDTLVQRYEDLMAEVESYDEEIANAKLRKKEM